MRIVADTKKEYQQLSRIQKQVTQLFKQEKENNPGGILHESYKQFINTSIEKSYEMPGKSAEVANDDSALQTDDQSLFIPYIVQAAVSRKKMAIEYASKKGASKRLIEPHTWRNGHVVAWCHERGAWRQFKPSQIIRLAVTGENFDRSEEVEIVPEDAKRPIEQ